MYRGAVYGGIRKAHQGWESLVHFVEGPGVREARVPDLVHDLGRVDVVLAPRPVQDRHYRPGPDAVLELLRHLPVAPREGLSRPPALAAQHRRADLRVEMSVQPWRVYPGRVRDETSLPPCKRRA